MFNLLWYKKEIEICLHLSQKEKHFLLQYKL